MAALLLGGLIARAASAEDLFAGTWVLRAAESKFANGELPESMTIQLETTAQGEHYLSRMVRRNQQVATAEYTATYDGRVALVLGDSGLMTPVSLKRIDDRTVEATYQRAFHIVARTRRVISADGRTMTLATTMEEGAKGALNVAVFERRTERLARTRPGQSE